MAVPATHPAPAAAPVPTVPTPVAPGPASPVPASAEAFRVAAASQPPATAAPVSPTLGGSRWWVLVFAVVIFVLLVVLGVEIGILIANAMVS